MTKANYDKLDFGATLNNNPSFSDCMNYGMVSGCDQYCPVLLSGKCKEPLEVIPNIVIDDEEVYNDLLLKYKK